MIEWTQCTGHRLGDVIMQHEIIYRRKYWGLFGPKIAIARIPRAFVCTDTGKSNHREPTMITLKIYELVGKTIDISPQIQGGNYYRPTGRTVVVSEIEHDLLSRGREIAKGPRVKLKPVFGLHGVVHGVYTVVNYGSNLCHGK